MRKLTLPLVRWHLRSILLVWAVLHAAVIVALSLPGGPPLTLSARVVGPAATIMVMVLTPILMMVDRRRVGAPLLFGNMGFSVRWLVGSTIATAACAEIVLHTVVRLNAAAGQ